MFIYTIIIFYFSEINNSKLELYKNLDKITIVGAKKNQTYQNNITIGNIKFLNSNKNIMFCNFPRKKSDKIGATFAKINLEKIDNNIFEPYPNKSFNIFNNCSNLISVVAFEIDDEDNIYILDDGRVNNNCSVKIIKYNFHNNNSKTYNVDNESFGDKNVFFEDILVDRINKYIYISFHENNKDNNIKPGIFLLKFDDNNIIKITKLLYNDNRLKPDKSYSLYINDNKLLYNDIIKNNSIGLLCDGEAFFFSSLSSKMIYSVLTKQIYEKFKNNDVTEINSSDLEINEGYKNDATSSMVSSNMGNLYFVGLEKNLIYISDLVSNDLSGFNYKGLRNLTFNKSATENILPLKITINNGYLYVLSVGFEIIEKEIKINNNYIIYKAEIDKDKPYTFPCAGLKYKWQPQSYIIWGLFIIIVIFVLVFVVIGNKQDKDINIKKNN